MGLNSRNSATDRMLNRPDRTRPVVPTVEPRTTDRTLPASDHLPPDVSGHSFVVLEPLCTRSDAASLRLVGFAARVRSSRLQSHRSSVRLSQLPSHRSSVRSFQLPSHQRPVGSASSFLRDLAYSLVPIFMLGLCLISWVFSCAPKVLLEVLIIGS